MYSGNWVCKEVVKGSPHWRHSLRAACPSGSFRCNVDGVRAKRSQLLSNTFLWEEGQGEWSDTSGRDKW